MQIHSLPIARPDETLYSVAARIRLANAARNDRDACRSMFGPSRNMRVSEFPVNLAHFCGITHECFGNPARVLSNLTLAGFFERLDSRPWHAGSSNAPVATAGYGLATLSNGSAGRWRICRRCVENDLAHHATAFWRRAHHLPTGFLCTIHDTPLATCMSSPLERHNRFLLPEQTSATTVLPEIDWVTHHHLLARLTALGIDVLEDGRQPVDARTVRATLFNALGDRGLLTTSGLLRRVQFASEFAHRYHFLSQHPDFSLALSPKGIDILQRGLSHPGPARSAAHNLLLIDWLFGTWQAFHQQCLWQATMDCLTLSTINVRQDEVTHQHRKACVAFLEAHTLATRSCFSRAAPASFRWLLRNDEEWLNGNLPRVRPMRTQGTLF
ncbi:TniQ family protein [Rugamonas sp. DEMB1]|uniref:TniQ family protein n=1 Tax=Rugamonas sp. DEMB1 TaxID=3039386 RepID=UPI0024476998|nr:TniQ family protein [Rugamonas sp. DEMB1]WGG50945.1 TniQ family protein [Rugamonas sp. DEMB1]